jgi:hypothetical protein
MARSIAISSYLTDFVTESLFGDRPDLIRHGFAWSAANRDMRLE